MNNYTENQIKLTPQQIDVIKLMRTGKWIGENSVCNTESAYLISCQKKRKKINFKIFKNLTKNGLLRHSKTNIALENWWLTELGKRISITENNSVNIIETSTPSTVSIDQEGVFTKGEYAIGNNGNTYENNKGYETALIVKDKSQVCLGFIWGETREQAKANAERIVKAVNNFDNLLNFAKVVSFLFNGNNYLEGSPGHQIAQQAKELLNRVK